jgi:DNA repair protein RadC
MEVSMETSYVREVAARYSRKSKVNYTIRGSEAVHKFVTEKVIKDNTKEHFVLLSLDGAYQVASWSVITVGTANASLVHPREVFQAAILSGAVAVIVCHNHPSGSTLPSEQDCQVTRRLKEAGELLGIKVLDHVIVTDDAFYSFSDNCEIL